MAEWFYVNNGQQVGPIEEGQLRGMIGSGAVAGDVLVWAPGMPQWISARTVPALVGQQAPIAAVAPVGRAPAGDAGAAGGGPMQLTYASPVQNEVVELDYDEGPFMKIGSQFTVLGTRWSGTTIASPKAIYLMKSAKASSAAAYGVGGLAGVLIQHALSKDDDVRTCLVGELPEPVRLKLDPKGKKAAKDAVVLPCGAIRHVKAGSFNNVLTVHIGGDKFTMDRGLFSGGKLKRFLTENGWTLNQELTPTAAAVHGKALGRTFEEMEKRKPNMFKRVALITAGILLIILVIVLRIIAGR